MARKTSFYYSFLVLPADERRAIVAVWDFCRAVDDAVDEEEKPSGAELPEGSTARQRSSSGESSSIAASMAASLRRRKVSTCSRSSRRSACRATRSRT